MFGRWRKGKEVAGLTCPLCGEISPEDTAECPKCYHQLQKGLLEQDDSVATAVTSSLFNELHADDEDEEPGEVVDWSRHTFDIDEVTIDVSQYEEGTGAVALSHSPDFAAIEADVPRAAKATPDTLEEGEYDLTTSDAPKNVEKFVVPSEKMVEETFEEPAHQVSLVVPLLPEGATSDGDELADPSTVEDEEPVVQTTSPQMAAPTPSVTPPPATTPPQPTPVPTAKPVATPTAAAALPKLPSQPQATVNGATTAPNLPPPPTVPRAAGTPSPPVPNLPTIPSASQPQSAKIPPPTPNIPAAPTARPHAAAFAAEVEADGAPSQNAPSSPPSVGDRIWPWPQQDAWEDLVVKRDLRRVMEAIKEGDHDSASRGMDRLGPHLGERREILFHVGVVLKKLGRDEALRKMLETARRLHPEDQHVATALTSLGM